VALIYLLQPVAVAVAVATTRLLLREAPVVVAVEQLVS